MLGDRVQVTNGTMYENAGDTSALVYIYEVALDVKGVPVLSHDGTVNINSLGGVPCGTTGVVDGYPEKVHRSQLRDANVSLGLGQNDFVQVLPIFLDKYQKLGWLPVDNVRVVAGGVAK